MDAKGRSRLSFASRTDAAPAVPRKAAAAKLAVGEKHIEKEEVCTIRLNKGYEREKPVSRRRCGSAEEAYASRMLESILLLVILGLTFLFPRNPTVLSLAMLCTVVLSAQFIRVIRHKSPPFIPTKRADVKAMVRLAHIRHGETAWDLGCGDGRIVRAAAREGAVSTGFELSYPTYLLAKILSLRTKNVFIRYGNFWTRDFAQPDVLFCFLLKETMKRFHAEIWHRLKPGSRVVSYLFRMPDIPVTKQEGDVYLYVK